MTSLGGMVSPRETGAWAKGSPEVALQFAPAPGLWNGYADGYPGAGAMRGGWLSDPLTPTSGRGGWKLPGSKGAAVTLSDHWRLLRHRTRSSLCSARLATLSTIFCDAGLKAEQSLGLEVSREGLAFGVHTRGDILPLLSGTFCGVSGHSGTLGESCSVR